MGYDEPAVRERLVTTLRSGGIVVIRTDTLYGLVASAMIQPAVERVYTVKRRDSSKPCIILIDRPEAAYINIASNHSELLRTPGQATSVLLPSPLAPEWLLRGGTTLAYRVPEQAALRELLALTGPLIAPSANPEGLPPATTVAEAKRYFGDTIDIYVDGGTVPADMPPSRLLSISENGTVKRLR